MATATEKTTATRRGANGLEASTRGKGLSPERIFETAKAIADDDGLDALTIRKLASELDVSPTAIYWHVRTRDELLRGVYDITLKTRDLTIDLDLPWRDQIATVCRAERKMMVEHPYMFALAQQFPGRGSLPTLRLMMTAAREAGYDVEAALRIARLLGTYAVGFSFVQTASEAEQKGPELEDLLREGGTEFVEIAPHLLTEVSDDLFELGLSWLINGIPEPPATS